MKHHAEAMLAGVQVARELSGPLCECAKHSADQTAFWLAFLSTLAGHIGAEIGHEEVAKLADDVAYAARSAIASAH